MQNQFISSYLSKLNFASDIFAQTRQIHFAHRSHCNILSTCSEHVSHNSCVSLTYFFSFVYVELCDESLDLLFSFTGAIVEKLFAYLIDAVTCFIETCYSP